MKPPPSKVRSSGSRSDSSMIVSSYRGAKGLPPAMATRNAALSTYSPNDRIMARAVSVKANIIYSSRRQNDLFVRDHGSLASMAEDQLHDLVVHRLRLLLGASANRSRSTVTEMIAQEFPTHCTKRLLDRRDLDHDIGAIPILLDHPLQTTNLALDPTKTVYIRRLQLRIDPDRLSLITGITRGVYSTATLHMEFGVFRGQPVPSNRHS